MENYIEHRKRVKDRFRKEGLENFDERYALELMLFYCVPRKDTRELAIRLLDHFGSIVDVLDATTDELERVPGVGEGISTFISFRRQLERYYQIKQNEKPMGPLKSPEEFGKALRGKFLSQRNEVVYVLCLDAKCKVLCCREIGEGSVNSAGISIRKIVETETDDIMLFGSMPPFAPNYPKIYIEPFAFKVQNQKHLHEAIAEVKRLDRLGAFKRRPIAWEVWSVIRGTDPNEINYNYIPINDYTCDIDKPSEVSEVVRHD